MHCYDWLISFSAWNVIAGWMCQDKKIHVWQEKTFAKTKDRFNCSSADPYMCSSVWHLLHSASISVLPSANMNLFFSGGNVTALGRKMTDFPLSPGLSRTVILSASLGCEDLVLPVAAMLSVENVFVSPGGKKNLSLATQIRKELAEDAGGTNDFATLLYIYKQCHSRWVIVTERPKPQERLTNRPYSYSQYWTGTSL